jgi:hypothetical protein
MNWIRWQIYRWKHRHDTLEQRKAALFAAWAKVEEEFKDAPAGREFHDAADAMDELRRTL